MKNPIEEVSTPDLITELQSRLDSSTNFNVSEYQLKFLKKSIQLYQLRKMFFLSNENAVKALDTLGF